MTARKPEERGSGIRPARGGEPGGRPGDPAGPARDRYLEEILGVPAAMERAAEAMVDQVAALGAVAEHGGPGPIVLTGMGSSHDACLAAAAALGAAGVTVAAIETAELLHVRRATVDQLSLVVVVSQSGRSAEAVTLAESLRVDRVGQAGTRPRRQPAILAITNGRASPLAGLADLVLDTRAGEEVCPSTMTFAGSLVALAALAGVLEGRAPATALAATVQAAGAASAAAARLLHDPEATGAHLECWLGGCSTILALGRGVGLAAAEMTALTLMEAAAVPAAAMPTAEFRHGPMEIAGPGVAVIIFALEPATETLDRDFAAELAATGAAVLLVGPPAAPPGVERISVPGPHGILSPAVALGPLQLLARRLAHARGHRPETFALASKVTTRE